MDESTPQNISQSAPKNSVFEEFGMRTPEDILDHPEMRDRVLKSLALLERTFGEQFSRMPAYSEFYLNRYLLRETVESCFCDMYRMKFFRSIPNEDSHQRAAFFVKWIVKLRPIQLRENVTPSKIAILANELFAIYIALVHLGISPAVLFRQFPNYVSNLVYLLHFRSCSPELLASEMFLLDQCVL